MKKALIFLSLLIISNLSFSEGTNLESINQNTVIATETDNKPQKVTLDVKSVYDSLNIKGKIDYSIFQKAYLGYVQIPNKNPGVLVIIDYSKPSNEERFYVLDLNKKKLVYSTRVAHSKNSGLEIPLEFSDDPNSYQSSLGFFLTLGEYNGAYGYSLRLKGLEENINANAESRAIVIHGGNIVDDEYIKKYGFAGRSLGCPVLPAALTKEIVNYIKHGRVLFIYGNDEEYIEESLYLSKLAPVFEGKPQNIVEIERPRETTKVVATTSTTSTPKVSTALNTPSASTPTLESPDQKNISIMLDVIKKEAEYKQHLSFRKSEKFVDYFAVMKNVVEDNSTVKHSETIATNTKTEDSKNVEILEKPKEIKDTEKSEKVLEKQETTVENKAQVLEESKKEDLKQEEIKKEEVKTEELKKEEPKKEEVKKVNRKYSEEVIRKSLGLGVKLKSKTK
ncbi:murein L,D-transpeptidase catalytic domain family protein [Fusobacterium pseudoperiodonticum]|uniref:murein L,D-transpeptidase catalytic domain family protein n=1 Tax=Fusobacterium pseudoperiodonticum TaxID=2663009 RepID=UPI0028D8E03F|nr:murein L,D-transpeptidase catalytic domain family protein [Fusobacterium pseudoperiodonticum]